MRTKSIFAVTLFFLSCSFSPPATRTEQPVSAENEDLLGLVRRSDAEGKYKETWKTGRLYLDRFPEGDDVPEVRLYLGKAGLNLGYLTDAREFLLPLAGNDADPSKRKQALRLLFRIEKEKGRYAEAAAYLLDAIGSGMDDSEYGESRNDLSGISGFLSRDQLERLRLEYSSTPGVDIILEGSLTYALAGSDTARVSELRRYLAAADSLRAVPDRVITRRTVPSFDRDTDAVEGKDIHSIGFLCPLSGRFAPLGEAFLAGASTALAEARMNGISGVELVVGDTKGNALQARELTERMIKEEQVSAFVGGVLSVSTIAAAQAAEYMKVVLYSPVASESGIDRIGDHIFQAQTSSDAELIAIARVACLKMGKRRIAFLSVDNHTSRVSESLFRESVELLGGSVVISDFYDQGNTDFKANIERIRNADPDALFIASNSEDLILILPQLSFYEFGIQLLGTSEWNSTNLLRMSGRDMEGAVFPAVVDLRDDEQLYRSAAAFTGIEVNDVNRFVIGGYIGVRKMLEIVARSRENGSTVREEMARSLEKIRHKYIQLVSGKGIPFYSVKEEKFVEYTTLNFR